MRRARRRAGALLIAVSLATARTAGAQMQAVDTVIDLNYTYEQEHLGPNVTAATGFQQKYQMKLETGLTSSLDFLGAISVDLDDKWDTDAASTSRISPSLELGVRGPQSAAKFTYSGVVSETDEFRETAGDTKYSNTADLNLELTPDYWPEIKFKLSEKRNYEAQQTDNTGRTLELQLRDEIYDVRLEFSLKLDTTTATLPERADTESIDWSGKASYKALLYSDVNFEVDYEIKESYSEDNTRGVFTGLSEDYSQLFKARLKKSLELLPILTMGLTWEYAFEQDLLQLEYDYKVQNKYVLDLRWDALPELKVTGEARRETALDTAIAGGEDTSKLTDTLKGAFDYEPVRWLRFGGRAEHQYKQDRTETSGGSIDHGEDRDYELTLKNKWGDFWDFTAGTSTSSSYTDGDIDNREAKLKADLKLRVLKLRWLEMIVQPRYEASREDDWDGPGDRTEQSSTSDAKIKFEIKAPLFNDLLRATFSHEYGRKVTETLDETLSFERVEEFNENTRLNLALVDLVEDLTIEGEVERSADDSDDDAEPEFVEVSYALKLDWKYEELALVSGLRYKDRDEDDDLEFTAKVGWKGEQFDVSGDYQYTKVYADETEEQRKFNLRLSYRF